MSRFRAMNGLVVAALLLVGLIRPALAQEEGPPPGLGRGIHDPSMTKQGNTWYVFSSWGRRDGRQLPIQCSEDLQTWRPCGYVFDQMPPWIRERLPGVRELWAPDISFEDGLYRLYYAYSILGKNTSGIGLATNNTLDRSSPGYGWVDQGVVIESTAQDDYNTIDPNFVRDEQGQDWLVFGSYWTGIKMRRLDAAGKLSEKDKRLYSLARRSRPDGAQETDTQVAEWQAIEAPYVVRHGTFYYLFTSWDLCCRGSASTYRIVVGRAKGIKGPYLDETGKKLMKGGGTTLLNGNAQWAGPGGQSVWTGPDSTDLLVFHAYDRITGRPALQISPIQWVDDWPEVAFPQPADATSPPGTASQPAH